MSIQLEGRLDHEVLLLTRPVGATDWATHRATSEDVTHREPRKVGFELSLSNIGGPFEYRELAGSAASRIHRVDVLRPLSLDSIQIEITPPAYTGLTSREVSAGDINVIPGSTAQFQFRVARPPVSAAMFLTRTDDRPALGENPQIQRIELSIAGTTLIADLELTDEMTYSIQAEAADGMSLAENQFLCFEEPQEALDVHSLTEVLLRIRARDDFGLSRAGRTGRYGRADG